MIRQLPNRGTFVDDDDAAAGKAAETRAPRDEFKQGAYFCFYNEDSNQSINRVGRIPKEEIVPDRYQLHLLGKSPLARNFLLVLARNWHVSFDLSSHFPWTFPDTEFEIWASMKFSGPDFDPLSAEEENTIRCDQVFLVESPEEKE